MTIMSIHNPFRGAGQIFASAVLALSLGAALPESTWAADAAAAQQQAMPVSVAKVEQQDAMIWHEFSGRLEAVERVDIRSRVAGAVEGVHFREGALVKAGDL